MHAAFPRVTAWTLFIQQREVEMRKRETDDPLLLYGNRFSSRLLLGTARYESPRQLTDAIEVADPAMLTVSVRRQLSASKDSGQSFWDLLRETGRVILPNTAGCLSAREAVQTACMARELFQTNLIKLEVIGDEVSLQPDPFGLVEAASELVKLGFEVLPYCTEDWVLCRRLMNVGCEVLMPWAAPIGTGQGPRNARALRELRQRAPQIPLIVDAGIGLPSHACQVMEWGFDGVLLNTAVSRANDPVQMASAFANAVRAGRGSFLAGPMVAQETAVPSTPEIGRPFADGQLQSPRSIDSASDPRLPVQALV
jgi:thiazole synthase